MNLIEEQYRKIMETYPEARLIDNAIYHINVPILKEVWLEINYKKFPKQPKVKLIKANGEVYDKLEKMVDSLKKWKKNNPLDIIDLITEIWNIIGAMLNQELKINRELLEGILGYCADHHPKEILGLLRFEKGVATEFILPPGSVTSENTGIFYPGRIPMDSSIDGTVHSHPSGNPYPSDADLALFKAKRFHIIVGYPYDIFNIRCFDQLGNELKLSIL